MSQQGKRKTKNMVDFYKQQNIESFIAYFMRILSNRTLSVLVFDKTSVEPYFAVVNCLDAVMSMFYSTVLTRSLVFLQS